MKSFRSLFYTIPAKGFFCMLIFVLSFLFSECTVRYYALYSMDKESFINANMQVDSFDYGTSYYFRRTVETTLENITALAFEYEDIFEGEKTEEELLDYFSSIGKSEFDEIYNNLSSMEGFTFALVNHSKGKIYSNISEINGSSSRTNIKSFFSGEGKNNLIVRSCRNPYFATDSFIGFSGYIRELAEEYEDNFDIYITFGSQEAFEEAAKKAEKLHSNMRGFIEKLNDTAACFIIGIVLVTLILLTVTGKQEPGGKTYPTTVNRLPNDLIILLYGIVLICQISLYLSSESMLLSLNNELNEFWFTPSHEFYTFRIRFCVVVFFCTAVNLLCILKRQYKTGQLIKNTYLYSAFSSLINSKKD